MPYSRRYRYKKKNVYGVNTGDTLNQARKKIEGQTGKRKSKKGSKASKYFKKGLRPRAMRKATRDHTGDMLNALQEAFGIHVVNAPKSKNYKKGQKLFKYYKKYGGYGSGRKGKH